MSKRQLEKELQNFDADQLRGIILDAYSANDGFKQYFEFFINPDSEKLADKYLKAVVKEFNRSKWRTSKARITVLRKLIKDFAGFAPGDDCVLTFIGRIIQYALVVEEALDFTPTLTAGIAQLGVEMIKYGDKHECVTLSLSTIDRMLIQTEIGNPRFRNLIINTIQDYSATLKSIR